VVKAQKALLGLHGRRRRDFSSFGLSFHDAVEHTVDEIAADPHRWPVFHRNYRWVKTKKFPYVLYFRIVDPYHVVIVALAHGRRRPGYWLRRS
jgi:ParE-like toxin of type II ParDE toxin-antitoxin system